MEGKISTFEELLAHYCTSGIFILIRVAGVPDAKFVRSGRKARVQSTEFYLYVYIQLNIDFSWQRRTDNLAAALLAAARMSRGKKFF
jgi:hypothetical protein